MIMAQLVDPNIDRDQVILYYQRATNRCQGITNESGLVARDAADQACERAFRSLDQIGLNDCEGWRQAQCREIPGETYQQCSVVIPVCEMFYQKSRAKTFADCASALMTEELFTGAPVQFSDNFSRRWQNFDKYFWGKHVTKGNQGSARVEPSTSQRAGPSSHAGSSSFAEGTSYASGSTRASGSLHAAGSSTHRASPPYSVDPSYDAYPTQAIGVLPSTSSFQGTDLALTAGPSSSGPPLAVRPSGSRPLPAAGPSGSRPPPAAGPSGSRLSIGQKRKKSEKSQISISRSRIIARNKSSARRNLTPANTSSDPQAPNLEVTNEQAPAVTDNPSANPNAGGSTLFVCQECGNSFQTSGGLKNHRLLHTGDTYCHTCEINLSTTGSLRRHMNLIHGKDLSKESTGGHACDICDKRFAHPAALSAHRATHDGQTICPVCNRVFARVSTLQSHMKKKHP